MSIREISLRGSGFRIHQGLGFKIWAGVERTRDGTALGFIPWGLDGSLLIKFRGGVPYATLHLRKFYPGSGFNVHPKVHMSTYNSLQKGCPKSAFLTAS